MFGPNTVDGYGSGAGDGKPYDGKILKQYCTTDGFIAIKMQLGHYLTYFTVTAHTNQPAAPEVSLFIRKADDNTDL